MSGGMTVLTALLALQKVLNERNKELFIRFVEKALDGRDINRFVQNALTQAIEEPEIARPAPAKPIHYEVRDVPRGKLR